MAILQFLAAAELLEADLWEQHNELGGIQDSERPAEAGNRAHTRALSVLDKDIPQYIHDYAACCCTARSRVRAALEEHLDG